MTHGSRGDPDHVKKRLVDQKRTVTVRRRTNARTSFKETAGNIVMPLGGLRLESDR